MQAQLILTVILLTAAALLTAFFGYMGARPHNPLKGPRMVPWRFLMMVVFTVVLLLLVHLLTMLGLKTDPPLRY
ncbi:hypothetical protein [Asticcacaulis sp. EMRT-3]|uniref:hypothetical protein n=1 Tax=Asticcacaulis sp. EMRT-3 TaxID=3040349 RepID=UPI0024AED512|nr:hypothetical protein [Asticcacaulis sp. EMRT-3]MDI7775456.1 hypothetical protein [Asticcacaulis sp. EMRT-3]